MANINPNIDCSKVKVLIVDDIPLNVMLIDKMLKRFSFSITKAFNGQDALKIVSEIQPHVILLDLMMPGMSGYEVIEELRKTSSKEELPIIVLSALNSNDDISKAMALGANDFITKPVVMERLHNSVVTLLNERLG